MTRNGRRLRILRGIRKQKEVAAAIGISPSLLSAYEMGTRNPSDENKVLLAQYHQMTVGEIFFSQTLPGVDDRY